MNDIGNPERSVLSTPITTTGELKTAIEETPFTNGKAVIAGVIGVAISGLGGVSVALADNVISPQEWITIGITVLVAAGGLFGGVYGVANHPKL